MPIDAGAGADRAGGVGGGAGAEGQAATVKLAELFKAPQKPAEREHVLAANELVLSVRFGGSVPGNSGSSPPPATRCGTSSPTTGRRRRPRSRCRTTAARRRTHDGARPRGATPIVAEEAATAVDGKEVTEATAAAAGEAAVRAPPPLSQNGYKVRPSAVAVKRALLTAAGAKKHWEA